MSEWADKYRYLSEESSAEPGKWRTDRAPYQREMMDAICEADVDEVVIMTSAQVGKTEVLNNIIGYHIDQDPCSMLMVQPTGLNGMAATWSKDRFAPMIRDTPALRKKIGSSTTRDSGNTILEKSFAGGQLAATGANSPAGLASRPRRGILFDEVDRYPESSGSEGPPIDLATQRTKTYWNSFILKTSTPTVKGQSQIESAFEIGDQRRYFVPCPHCKSMHVLQWANVTWDKDPDGNAMPETARMECPVCEKEIDEVGRYRSVKAGEWRPTAAPKNPRVRSYHINAMYSPWERLENIVRAFINAKGDPIKLRAFVNLFLGECWEDKVKIVKANNLMARREPYDCTDGEIPDGVLAITAGIDVQDDRLEMEVVGWGDGEESWSLEYVILRGDPDYKEIWERLDDALNRKYTTPHNVTIRISRACIDTGYKTKRVYWYCANRWPSVLAIKGRPGMGHPIVSSPTKRTKRKVPLYHIGVDAAKDTLYTRLQREEPGPGYCHFPATYDQEHFDRLTAEKKVLVISKGRRTYTWELKKSGARNEQLDTRIYAMGALDIFGVNLSLLAEKMQKRIKVIEDEVPDAPAQATQKRRKLRRRKKSWL